MDLVEFFNNINEELFEGKWKIYRYSEHMSIKCSSEEEFFEMMEKTTIVIKKYLYYNIRITFDLEKLKIFIECKKDL